VRRPRDPHPRLCCGLPSTAPARATRSRRVCGGLLAPDGDVEDALTYANAVAALNCRGLGARGAMPTRAEVSDLLIARPQSMLDS
jgi:sugar/nucleoside kinase (ribokinase family)